jgi:hypothetical protein
MFSIGFRYTKSDGTNTHTTTATSYGSLENTAQLVMLNIDFN